MAGDRGAVHRRPRRAEEHEHDDQAEHDGEDLVLQGAPHCGLDSGEQGGQGGAADEEGGDAEGLALEAGLDPAGVRPGPAEHGPLGGPVRAVDLPPLVELADAVDHRVLVVLDQEADDLLRRPLRHRLQRTEAGHGRRPDPVAIEHLQGAHGHAVRLEEPVGSPERFAIRHLVDDVLLGLAADTDLLEQLPPRLGIVLPQHPQRRQPFGQLVEDEVALLVLGGPPGSPVRA